MIAAILFQTLDPIDWAKLIALVPALAPVVVFMVYEERRRKADTDAREKRDIEADTARKESEINWQTFLKEERAERAIVLAQISNAVSASANVGNNINTLLLEHDQWERQRMTQRRTNDERKR